MQLLLLCCSLCRRWDAFVRVVVVVIGEVLWWLWNVTVCAFLSEPGYILKLDFDLITPTRFRWKLFSLVQLDGPPPSAARWNPFWKWMMFSIFLLAATSKNCPQLLLLLLMSSAAKTQIYSQEVAFNCHFLFLSCSVPRRESAAANVLYYSWRSCCFFFGYRWNFAIFAALLFRRVHNPSWLRNG